MRERRERGEVGALRVFKYWIMKKEGRGGGEGCVSVRM